MSIGVEDKAHDVTESAVSFKIYVKKACETCTLLQPLIARLVETGQATVFVQDDPVFFSPLAIDDSTLEQSFHDDIEVTPTLLKFADGKETERVFGWDRAEWRRITGLADLGEDLRAFQPGCGSKSREPGVHEHLVARFGDSGLESRKIVITGFEDPMEAAFERGWTDGLPIIPPTDERILRMLGGTRRDKHEVVGRVPPNLSPVTIEKIAINAVMAGCKPEYMPVVIAAVEAALEPIFTMHGLLCTTCFSGPIIVVNGPIAKRIGMNWGMNALGQGNRANATIGRALQLIIRNVGGGIPGDLDRSTLGGPGKYTFCFAEDETDPSWEPLSVARGLEHGENAVTLFQGDGIQGVVDQRSATPEQMAKSLAMSLLAVGHPKLAEFTNAMLVLSPEHYAIFRNAGWDRARITAELHAEMVRPGAELVFGAQGVGEGIAADRAGEMVSKFWPEGLLIVRAGGQAGLYSAICGGWTGGRFRHESQPVTRRIAL